MPESLVYLTEPNPIPLKNKPRVLPYAQAKAGQGKLSGKLASDLVNSTTGSYEVGEPRPLSNFFNIETHLFPYQTWNQQRCSILEPLG